MWSAPVRKSKLPKRRLGLKSMAAKARYNKSAVAGLGACLVGTTQTIADRICAYEDAGLDLLLLQFNPMEEGLERFLSDVLPLVERQRGRVAREAASAGAI